MAVPQHVDHRDMLLLRTVGYSGILECLSLWGCWTQHGGEVGVSLNTVGPSHPSCRKDKAKKHTR